MRSRRGFSADILDDRRLPVGIPDVRIPGGPPGEGSQRRIANACHRLSVCRELREQPRGLSDVDDDDNNDDSHLELDASRQRCFTRAGASRGRRARNRTSALIPARSTSESPSVAHVSRDAGDRVGDFSRNPLPRAAPRQGACARKHEWRQPFNAGRTFICSLTGSTLRHPIPTLLQTTTTTFSHQPGSIGQTGGSRGTGVALRAAAA